jgi:geranylgeranyl pyrophosphate synthase
METKDRYLALVERTLDAVLPPAGERPAVLGKAMRYAVGSGGKRIRPLVCLGAAVAAGGRAEDAVFPAAAIELLHNYTLVHDDLPAMDNDEVRRGRPTVWKRYGEANAILVADALQALAFGAAARSPRNAAAIVSELAVRGVGVVRGQVVDIVRPVPAADVDFVYEHKTADLFVAAAAMGALAAGASPETTDTLRRFAFDLGMAFQFQDDLLDGDSPYGRETTTRLADERTAGARAALAALPGDATFLAALAGSLVGRTF